MRKTALLSLLGLVLMAVTLVECERRIVSRDRTVPIIPAAPPTPANSIIVQVAGTPSDLNGVKVVLLTAGLKIDSAVITGATTSPATVRFDSVAGTIPVQATYQVNLRHSTQVGFTFQSQLVSITGPTIPVVAFTLRKIENTNTIQVVPNVTVDQSAVTTVTVQPPPAVTSTTPTAAPAKVNIAAGSGVTSVSVSTQTAEEVPAIVQNNVMTQAVIGAIQIQTLTPNANATFSVNIPLPIDSTDRARAAGGSVDVLRYDVGTGSWTKIGTYKIRLDGTVQVDDIKGIDENTIISIGSTPGVSEAKQESLKTEPVLDVNQTEALKRRGDSTVTYDLSPKISGSTRVGKLALPVPGLPRIAPAGQPLPAPAAIPGWAWPNIRNYIGNRYPELADWLNTGNTSGSVKLPEGTVEVLDNGVIRRITYQITFGNLKYTFTIEINVKLKVIRFLWHGSGVIG